LTSDLMKQDVSNMYILSPCRITIVFVYSFIMMKWARFLLIILNFYICKAW